jgi:beta-glucosidase
MNRRLQATGAFLALVMFLQIAALEGFSQPAAQSKSAAGERAELILRQMTLDEKIDYIGGVDDFFVRDIPRLGVPRFKMADGPIGVRNYGVSTTMAGGIALAATWNPELAMRVGTELGRDARARGVHFLLGPAVNIYVAPMNGRNFEYLGEDPFLASRIAVNYIKGVQSQGVCATIKHFMGNNSEFNRHNIDAVIDERAMREIYLPAFEAAVKEAKVGAIMDSYNLVNGVHMTQNSYLNREIAKRQWGFEGIIMSDWLSTYDAVAAANAGLDLEMPSGAFMNRKNLLPALEQGALSAAAIDDKVRRILRTAAAFGWLDRDQTDPSISRFNFAASTVALESARESMVLLKNEGSLLPLKRQEVKSIAVIGPNAYPGVPVGGGSAHVVPYASISFLQGVAAGLGNYGTTYYERGIPSREELARRTRFQTHATNGAPGLTLEIFDNTELAGSPRAIRTVSVVDADPAFDGTVGLTSNGYSLRWTGFYTPEQEGEHYLFVQGPGEGGGYRLFLDGKLAIDEWSESRALLGQEKVMLTAAPHKIVLEQFRTWNWESSRIRMGVVPMGALVDPAAVAVAAKADVVVAAVGFAPETESEGADRTFALPLGEEELLRAIAAVNKKTIVVMTSGGGAALDFLDRDRVPALIEAWYPGQEGGTALAEILFGDVNPSGRLPISIERRWEDNPTHDSYYPEQGTKRVKYANSVFVGYRGYEHNGVRPLFPFGFGLSYTTFKYSNLEIRPSATGAALFDVSFDITNTGSVAGADVAQVYVGDKHAKVARPVKELKGFARVRLEAGETQRVTIPLDGRSFSYYDVVGKHWQADAGDFDLLVGRSSEQIELRGTLTLKQTLTDSN